MSHFDALNSILGADRLLSQRGKDRLEEFVALVQKWNPAINIIGKSTEPQIWHRHVLDSAQLFSLARPDHRLWLDIGSGGGFPGLVLAILAADGMPALRFILVESDRRKAVFLSEAARNLGLAVTVHPKRIEDLPPAEADVVSARALAPLSQLCAHAERHLKMGGLCVFPKGEAAEAEIGAARQGWSFGLDRLPSQTDSTAAVLVLKDLRRV